jgi:hypothetical protein
VKKIILFIAIFFITIIPGYSALVHSSWFKTAPASSVRAQKLVEKVEQQFSRIRDARADFTLDTNLYLFGCVGFNRLNGVLYYKAPDLIKCTLNKDTWLFKGNFIRKTDAQGKATYYRLINAPDLSVGFTPRLIYHNFNLKVIRESSREVAIEALPKPGVLKNVIKVIFYIDPAESLLRGMDMVFENKSIHGKADIKYGKIGDIWIPISTAGESAFESKAGYLIGFSFSLKGKDFHINTGLTDNDFK